MSGIGICEYAAEAKTNSYDFIFLTSMESIVNKREKIEFTHIITNSTIESYQLGSNFVKCN